jgi:hypothetical protein
VLESCWSGRYVGTRTGEQLSLATLGLLAGAEAVVGGIFGLPSGPDCTGRIAGALVDELAADVPAHEAVRRARARYWYNAPATIRRPRGSIPDAGRADDDPGPAADAVSDQEPTMPGRAPLAWAGLCVWVRP